MTTWVTLGSFFHGLTFFTLCLTVNFLQYRSRRIVLARRLDWLGIFAVIEAVIAWNDLFSSRAPEASLLPPFLRLALLGFGYTFLLAFGIQTFTQDDTPPRQLRRLLWGLNVLWSLPYLLALPLILARMETAAPVVEALMRYLLAFPGGILAAIGLRRQSYKTLDASLRGRIRPYLRLVETMVAAFGILNLFLVPPAGFFPASYVHVNSFFVVVAEWIWSIIGAGLTLGLNRTLTSIQGAIEHWIEGVERLQTLAVDRERISRDLHDGIIQSIYASGLLLEGVQHTIPHNPQRAQAQLDRVMDSLNETIQDIRRYIFDLRSDIPDEDVQTGIARLLRDFRVNTLLETNLEVEGAPVEILSVERRRHIFQIVREALTNTARHAQASWVKIKLHYGREALELTISDNGVGMEKLPVSKGYGLRNIRERVRLLDGTLRIESAPGEGVTYHLTVPYQK